jgi:AcrR family transcriptional regulator
MLVERQGSPITLTSLAQAAKVSRRTLYTHWGTVERIIAEAVVAQQPDEKFDPDMPLGPRGRLEFFLKSVRTGISDPITTVALASLMSKATTDDRAVESLIAMGDHRMSHFAALLGNVPKEIYAQLVGPIFFAEFTLRVRASDELIDQLVDRGMELLGLYEDPVAR